MIKRTKVMVSEVLHVPCNKLFYEIENNCYDKCPWCYKRMKGEEDEGGPDTVIVQQKNIFIDNRSGNLGYGPKR